MKHLILLLAALAASAGAQSLPVVLGGAIEAGNGFTRVTPFAGVWLPALGYARLGYGAWNTRTTDAEGYALEEKERHFSAQVGANWGGEDRPYAFLTYARVWQLTTQGDSEWNEWGLGIGNRFALARLAAIILEVEYRAVMEHTDHAKKETVSGSRLQFNLGLAAYIF